ncbi:MAG: U32 family peptidase [Bacilli bacterium]|nr:U32 family peptidase [Bacilli bacterium]
MAYQLLEDGEEIEDAYFALSTKDLMTLDYVSSLIDLDVDSLKIEGRLKSEEYIYTVTKAYRHALDAVFEARRNDDLYEDKKNLQKIFSRNFTKGFLNGETPFGILNMNTSSHQGERVGEVIRTTNSRVTIKLEKPVHRLDGIRFNDKRQFGLSIEKMFIKGNPVEEARRGDIIELSGIENAYKLNGLEVIRTKDYLLNKNIEEELKNKLKVGVSASFTSRPGEAISLSLEFNGHSITVEGDVAQIASGSGTSWERIKEQLSKSGDYPYYINNINIDVKSCFIPVSSINKLRNDAFEKLRNSMTVRNNVGPLEYISSIEDQNVVESIKAIVESPSQEIYCKNMGFETFSDDGECSTSPRVDFHPVFRGEKTIVNYPIIARDREFIASEYCNITNSYALDCYFELGCKEAILSLELDSNSIKELIADFKRRHGFTPNTGIIAYGREDAMLLRSCPIGTIYGNKKTHCERCHNHHYELKDRVGARYTLIGDRNCNTRVLLDRPIYLIDKIEELHNLGISNIYLRFIDENDDTLDEVVMSIWNKENVAIDYTRGHFTKKAI